MPELKKTKVHEHIDNVKSVCGWLGLKEGRTNTYIKYIEGFIKGERKRENLLAINESFEAIEIYNLWKDRVDEYHGLYKKIKKALLKGPVLQEDELVNSSSNEARNNSFTYFISGLLLSRGINVTIVDGCSKQEVNSFNDDIELVIENIIITIECKRPQSKGSVLKRAKEAVKKINKRKGIIAIDYSSIIRPYNTLYEADSENEATKNIGDFLETFATEQIQSLIKDNILGLIMFARIPTMTRIRHEKNIRSIWEAYCI